MNYYCCTERRRHAVREHPYLTGIDFLEIIDQPGDPLPDRQTTLILHFLNALPTDIFSLINFLIKGGERIVNIQVVDIQPVDDLSLPDDHTTIFEIRVSAAGDFSTYTLCLVDDNRNPLTAKTLPGFDELLAQIDFSFKVACPNNFDCNATDTCEEEKTPPPLINYLAKDYMSFRQLMLDRMSLLTPGWKDRNPADMGIMLVELLAYTADYLSYQQDALTSEAYLGTARKRRSVRRHARLVDYRMHDGCNARTWLHLQVPAGINGLSLTKGDDEARTRIWTKLPNFPNAFGFGSPEYERARNSDTEVFELMHDIDLYHQHNELSFYTYGEESCCLPKGATEATLYGHFPNLRAGDVIMLVQKLDPENGTEHDADPKHRHAVRLTETILSEDVDVNYYMDQIPTSPPDSPIMSPPVSPPDSPPTSPPASPPSGETVNITKIRWHEEDALPFSFCISHRGEEYFENASVGYGNMVLVDHGITIKDQEESKSLIPSKVPGRAQEIAYIPINQTGKSQCEPTERPSLPLRFNPVLNAKPLNFAVPINDTNEDKNDFYRSIPASRMMDWDIKNALPSVYLEESPSAGPRWIPQRDLLIDSAANNRHFVVEMESDGRAHLRFGDDKNGARPDRDTQFTVTYRKGNGVTGNIGANTLCHLTTSDPVVIAALNDESAKIWNPLPAQGGREPESLEEVRQYAPEAFRTQERAVISSDYEMFAKKCRKDVQRATAALRWTGSWYTNFVTVDRLGGKKVDIEFTQDLKQCLDKYRMAGTDLKITDPIFVSLDIEVLICVHPDFLKKEVHSELMKIFNNRGRKDGQLGIFHPENFSFGQPVYLSRLYAAAQGIQGVTSVEFKKFQRLGDEATNGIESGKLNFGPREIARLDNNPNFRDRGIFTLVLQGGR